MYVLFAQHNTIHSIKSANNFKEQEDFHQQKKQTKLLINNTMVRVTIN